MVNNSKRMQMNEIVKTNIERYITDANPQYAILISGTWGTGKTFFIKQWITQYTNKCHEVVQTEDERILPPIQVSLFGTSSIQDIYERVREALNPKLYKVFKWGTFVADKATKIITGCELLDDVDIPFEADMGMWKKSNKTSKGCHLLILDDLERSADYRDIRLYRYVSEFISFPCNSCRRRKTFYSKSERYLRTI